MKSLVGSASVQKGILLAAGLVLVCSFSACNLLPGQKHEMPAIPGVNSGDKASMEKQAKASLDAGNEAIKSKNWVLASQELEKAATLDPQNADAHANLGWAYAEQKDWEKAKQHLQQAIAVDPDHAAAHANLAWVYAEMKNWSAAQEEAKKAISLNQKNGYAHATLAWTYQETKQPELAISEYEKSIELIPGLENSHLALGVLYCDQGIKTRAEEHYQHLLKLKSPKADELAGRISKGCVSKP